MCFEVRPRLGSRSFVSFQKRGDMARSNAGGVALPNWCCNATGMDDGGFHAGISCNFPSSLPFSLAEWVNREMS